MARPKRVAYFYDNEIGHYSYGVYHCMKPYRMRMAHNLISTYGMLDKMQVLRPRRSTPEEMTAFHTDEYVDFLSKVTPETVEELTMQGDRFLAQTADNPAFEGLFEFCSISAGGSVGAAEHLTNGAADITINWAGGLHHAKKREASGFCYVNDIVLCIISLLRAFPRVLYIDIDCHHGDGVEEAFYTTDRVLTCSFHKFGEYFPGTGHVDDRGYGQGKGYSVNVPLRDGLRDDAFKGVFEEVIQRILDWYRPSAIVLQLGADSLAGDKLGCFNISMEGHAHSVNFLRNLGIPLMLLGGGGYTIRNVARCWTYETACALGIEGEIDRNLPYNDYFDWFGPRYRLEVPENNMEDLNEKDGYLENIKREVLQHLRDLPHAPSVQLQSVPGESMSEHLGYRYDDEDEDELSELDERIASHVRRAYNTRSASPSSASSPPEPEDLDGQNYFSSDSETSTRPKRKQRRAAINLNGTGHPSHTNGIRMSKTTNTYLPTGARNQKRVRAFFASSMIWDPDQREVVHIHQDGELDLLGEVPPMEGGVDVEGEDDVAMDEGSEAGGDDDDTVVADSQNRERVAGLR